MTGESRNAKCPCGSGRKRKRCPCGGRRPRSVSVVFDYGRPVAHDRVDIIPDGVVRFSAEGVATRPLEAYLETIYEREHKPKIVHRTPLDTSAPGVNPDIALERFDLLLAIDTNSDEASGISVGCVARCDYLDFGQKVLVMWEPRQLVEIRNPSESAENIVWRLVLESIAASSRFKEMRSVGVIVDSNLGRIPMYNARQQPIVGDFYLPAKMELLYASADTGSEFVANKLIGVADRVARSMLRKLLSGKVRSEGLKAVEGQPFSHYRQWLPGGTGRDDWRASAT